LVITQTNVGNDHANAERVYRLLPGPALLVTRETRGDGAGGFSTRTAGAPEQAWRALLKRAPILPTLKGSILIVAPHPDDETFAAAGLMLRYPGARVLAVSDGEAAYAQPGLRSIRRRELRRSLAHARGTSVAFLRIPDGQIGKHRRHLETALQTVAARVGIIVAPYESDGHPDHDSVGAACRRVARRNGIPLLRYFIWRWHLGNAEDFDSSHFVRLPLTAHERHTKQRMMASFQSQLQGDAGPREGHAVVPPHVLRYFARPYEAFLK
jgi:LmbE family N-acetylglucosaminyl deacetylase